ncbi:MAG: hypothetical protein ACPGJS_07510 [Flammeovirgaceae bacterium]
MQLKTKVIVSGVTNLHDARYCAGMGVDMIAFPIHPNAGEFVNEQDFKEIVEWLSGPKFLAELDDAHELNLSDYPIDGALTANPALINQTTASIILKITDLADASSIMERYESLVEGFLVETEGALPEEQQKQLIDLCQTYTIYLGAGIDKDNVNELLDSIKPAGIGLKGSKEIKVGYNDFDGLADVLEEIEVY